MLLIIKPQALSAVQQLSSHPGLALFNSINTVRLPPPNNWITNSSSLLSHHMNYTRLQGCRDREAGSPAPAILPPPWNCNTQLPNAPARLVTTAVIFSNLVLMTWMYDTCCKKPDNYCYVYLCRVYTSALLSAILSKLCPLSTFTRTLSSRDPLGPWSMLVLAEKHLLPLCTHPAGTHNCYLGFRFVPGMKTVLIKTLSLEQKCRKVQESGVSPYLTEVFLSVRLCNISVQVYMNTLFFNKVVWLKDSSCQRNLSYSVSLYFQDHFSFFSHQKQQQQKKN